MKWNRESAINKLIEVSNQINHSPTYREIDKSLASACAYYYGSFNKAKIAIGLKTYSNIWTEEDLEYLRNHHHNMLNFDISQNINHSIYSIAHKAMEIGLTKDKEFIYKVTLPTQFKKGSISPNKGVPLTEEMKNKLSNSMKGKHFSPETEFKRGDMVGSKNNNWKGGVTRTNEKIRKLEIYKTWQNMVYERDNFTCQECGDNRGGNLNAHHIIQFSNIIDKYNIKELADCYNCKELWDISNGITLCKDCHIRVHSLNPIDIQ